MKVEKISIEKLKISPYNPRVISNAERIGLKNSLKKFGQVEPLVWNERSSFVVGGNQRLDILKELGYKEVDAVIVNLSEIEEKALNLALNNPAIQGKFTESVKTLIDEIRIRDITIVDDLRLEEIIKDAIKPDITKDIQDFKIIPELEVRPFEHYDYVFIVTNNAQDWNYLMEFFQLKRVKEPDYKGKKIGLQRGILFEDFMKQLKRYKDGLQNSNSKPETTAEHDEAKQTP